MLQFLISCDAGFQQGYDHGGRTYFIATVQITVRMKEIMVATLVILKPKSKRTSNTSNS